MRVWAAGLFTTTLALSGCGRSDGGGSAPAPTAVAASASVPPVAGSAGGRSPRPEGPHGALGTTLHVPTEACRVMAVKGAPRMAGKAVHPASVLDGSAWVELEEGAEISVKHAATARELMIRGPGALLACPSGEERLLITSGQISTTPTLGARPGAEVLLGTPLGVVRYGDGRLTVTVGKDTLEVKVTTGLAWLDGPGVEALPRGVPAGKGSVLKALPLDVKSLVAACEAAARAAESRARAVLAPPLLASSPLGERAQAHVQARRGARSVCATARARLGPKTEAPEDEALERRVSAADELWRGVPSAREGRPTGGAPSDQERRPTGGAPSDQERRPTGGVPSDQERRPTGGTPEHAAGGEASAPVAPGKVESR